MKIAITLLALQALVFIFWTVLSFVILGEMRGKAVARGGTWPSMSNQIAGMGDWLRDPEMRGRRRGWITLTLVMFALIAAFAAAVQGE